MHTNYQDEDVDALAKEIGQTHMVRNDVWATKVIDNVKKVFPETKMGDRIMMTTLDKRVATYANPDPPNLKFLTETESFELLIKRALGKGSCPDVLVQLGESIAEKCDGVPLAVVVIVEP
ncbi:hypothetical protein FXO38_32397 [Capsicum annuum]|nr:hypothetical protein FXO38_32397 [Capsicum annuum]